MEEVADSGRKAIVFSQWVEPLQMLAGHLAAYGPLQYHGKFAPIERTGILDRFRTDPDCRVLLMSYGTGSVGLNLRLPTTSSSSTGGGTPPSETRPSTARTASSKSTQ